MGWVDQWRGTRAKEEWMQQEVTALRLERAQLQLALADARDRGDRLMNALLEAKGSQPVPLSPSSFVDHSDSDDHGFFDEEEEAVERMQQNIKKNGAEVVFSGY